MILEVLPGKEEMRRIEAVLVLVVAAFHLAVVLASIGTDELVSDRQFSGSALKHRGDIPFAVGKAVGKFKAVVGPDTLHPANPSGHTICQISLNGWPYGPILSVFISWLE